MFCIKLGKCRVLLSLGCEFVNRLGKGAKSFVEKVYRVEFE